MSRNIKVPFFKPSLGPGEIRAARRVIRSGQLSTGPESIAFEKEFAAFVGNDVQALSLNSATAGLHLSLDAIGNIGPGDLVAVPSLTFTATAEVIRYLGAAPLFIDSERETGNMDSECLSERVAAAWKKGQKTKAVIPVHLAGHPCDMQKMRQAVSSYNIPFIEDAAHSFPSITSKGMAGTWGDLGVFSFYANKTITTGEGGMVVTRNPEFAGKIQLMRLHGIDREVWNRYSSNAPARSWEYDIAAPGYKYNLTDIAASIGRIQLKRAMTLLKRRQAIAMRYHAALQDVKGLELPPQTEGHSWHNYIVHAASEEKRDHIMDTLSRNGIGSSVHFIPLHRMSYWRNTYNLHASDFPVADDLGVRRISLPIWPRLKKTAQKRIIQVIRSACA